MVSVSEDLFSESDELCLAACQFVCDHLEDHLFANGHQIGNWIRGGCYEDWGIYFESQRDGETFEYQICFFPGHHADQILVQYHRKASILKRPFTKSQKIEVDHSQHRTMHTFARRFETSELLTRSELEKVV